MTPQEALLKAAELIERTGWAQGGYALNKEGQPILDMEEGKGKAILDTAFGGATRFCSEGALMVVTDPFLNGPALFNRSVFRFERFLENRLGLGGCVVISHWNDEPGRTKEEVVQMLRKAAASEE